MADYYEGVRAVLSGKAKPEFPGLLGNVAGLVQVEPALERAVEVALGNHIQDIVAESWDEAQKAIDYLKRNRAGGRRSCRSIACAGTSANAPRRAG